MARTLSVGESLVGDGNEVAHIDLLIGSKDGPVGEAFAGALLNQKEGHTNLLAVVAPNLPAKPDTIMANKVTLKGEKQVGQMFGPAQAAVARAVVDSVRDGVIPEGEVDDLCIIVGVFIHWLAEDDKKIFDWNYQATKESIARAMAGEPAASTVIEQAAEARHPFAGGHRGLAGRRAARPRREEGPPTTRHRSTSEPLRRHRGPRRGGRRPAQPRRRDAGGRAGSRPGSVLHARARRPLDGRVGRGLGRGRGRGGSRQGAGHLLRPVSPVGDARLRRLQHDGGHGRRADREGSRPERPPRRDHRPRARRAALRGAPDPGGLRGACG